MQGRSKHILPCLFIALFAATVVQSALAQQSSPHTRVKLLADVESVQPGGEFTVGLLMDMDKGWHTYWKNAGEAGIPTEIHWKLPQGITAGEIIWPLPHKYIEAGEVLTYGYEKETMLLVSMRADASLPAGTNITLDADITWLECESICIPGNASVSIVLPVRSSPPSASNGDLFGKYRHQVPAGRTSDIIVSAKTARNALEIRVRPAGTQRLHVEAGAIPDFYPFPDDEMMIGRTVVVADPEEATLSVPLAAYESLTGPRPLGGVVVYQLENGTRAAVEYSLELTREFCEQLPLAGTSEASGVSVLDQTFSTVEAPGSGQPLYLYVAFALLGGLLLNIMPCVLPVIALKLFGLVKMSGDHPEQVKRHGWSFSAGIIVSFLALALLVIIIQAAGDRVGWGFQFQEPLFVIAMSAIVFAFGLSLFGVYELGLPFMLAFAGVGSMLEKKAREGKGYSASFSEGIFATILATPCTAPFLGTALGFAFVQPAYITLLIFGSAAVGMALPYLILTAKPSWMKFLPKPGEWMVTAKQFMGFLMMGTLLWLLYVLGKQLGVEAVIWTGAFLLAIGIACWIVGRYATLNASRPKYLATLGGALLIIVAGYVIFLESILDVRNVIAGTPEAGQQAAISERDGIPWESFSIAGLDAHLGEGRAVFIDFTADWCLTCKVNEKSVLTDRRIVERLRTGSIIPIKADWTNRNPEITQMLAKFGRSGVPLYVVFPAGKPHAPIILPEVITTGIVLDALDRAQAVTSATIAH